MKTFFLIIASIISLSIYSQNFVDYTLPELNRENFPLAEDTNAYGYSYLTLYGNSFSKNISYSVQAYPTSNIPFAPLPQGETMRIKLLLPPGCTNASMSATSGTWQDNGVMLACFDYSAGQEYVHANRPDDGTNFIYGDNKLYQSDMHVPGGGWNDPIFGSVYTDAPVLLEPRYVYCYVHLMTTSNYQNMTFASFEFSYLVKDYELYEKWVLSQAWGNTPPPIN